MHPDVTYATSAFDAGASGYVLKNSASRELVTAIKAAVQGKTYVTPIIAGELIQTYQNSRSDENIIDRKLTDRQKEILHLVVEGYSAKEIANILSISPRTVETHKYNMMQELNLKNTADLIKFAIKNNLTTL